LPAVTAAPLPRRLVPGEALAAGHHRHEVHADEPRPGARLPFEDGEVELARGLVRDHRIGHPLLADAARERAGVDAAEPDDAATPEPLVERAGGAVVRGLGDVGAQDHAARARRRREIDGLDVLLVGADIADVREREGDDLSGIGRIGQDLLVAGHRGVETHLAHRVAGSAAAEALEHGPVGEYEHCGRLDLGPAGACLPFGHGPLLAGWRPMKQGPRFGGLWEPGMLREGINDALKEAMKAGDKRRVSTLRLVKSAVKNADIEARGQGKGPLSDEELLSLLQKMIKQRQESVELYEKGGRPELAQQEREEIAIIAAYSPQQMTEAEMRAAVDAAVAETGAAGMKDMGKVMAALKTRHGGKMDFAKASGLVKARLAG